MTSSRSKADCPEGRRDRRRSGTRTRPGGPTARSCSTSATAATAPRGAPVIYRWRRGQEDQAPADRARATSSRRSRPMAGTSRRPRPALRATTSSILDARQRASNSPRLTNDGASWVPGLVADRRLDRVPPHRRPDRRPADGPARRQRPRTGRSARRHRPDRGVRPRRRRRGPTGSSRPTSCPAADPDAGPRSCQPRAARAGAAVTADLPRPAGRPVGVRRHASCASDSIPTRRGLPARLLAAIVAGVEAFARLIIEAAAPVRRRGQAEPRASIEALRRRPAWPPSSGSGHGSRPTSPSSSTRKRGDIRSTAARQAVALFDRLGADAVTVNPYPVREAIAPLLERAGPLRLRPVPDVEPRARPSSRTSIVAADPATGAPGRAASTCRVARRAAAWGPAWTVGLVVGATAPDGARARIGRSPRACAFLVPGIGAQGGDIEPVLARRSGTRVPRRPAGRVAASWSTSRAASPAPPSDEPATGAERPRRAARGGRPRAGPTRLPVLP